MYRAPDSAPRPDSLMPNHRLWKGSKTQENALENLYLIDLKNGNQSLTRRRARSLAPDSAIQPDIRIQITANAKGSVEVSKEVSVLILSTMVFPS